MSVETSNKALMQDAAYSNDYNKGDLQQVQINQLVEINKKIAEHLEKGIKVTSTHPIPIAAPLADYCFAIATLLNNLVNCEAYVSGTAVVQVTCFIMGGVIQILAALLVFKKGSFAGFLFFMLYGTFWCMNGALWIAMGSLNFGTIQGGKYSSKSLGWYLITWCVISITVTPICFLGNLTVKIVMVLADLLYLILGINDFVEERALKIVGGYIGVAVALIGFYNGTAGSLEICFRKPILPVGKPKQAH